ncbi:unnamed protein product [Mytilus edulis]|uniref:Ubiquitin-like protease family profile domain-containing protein n=1 Tax=Mytilus edulis TaxID=6550 RepID=A0A8S3S4Z8_MYTED|nr:unnamed protein product [Mytilus edulis]
MDVYRDSISNSDIPGVQQGVMNARNVKQVENIVRKVNEQKRISKDDIYNLMLLAYHMEGYIQEITVFPDLTSIIALPEMISIVNQLLDVNTEDDQPFLGRQPSTTETPKSRKKLKFKSKEQDTDTNSCATPKKGKILKFSVDTKERNILSPPVSPTSTNSLPMKKRKVNTDVKKPSYTPWISSLNSEHKLMLENNSWLCSEIVNVSINVIAKQFPYISGFQPTGLSPIYDEDKQCWAESFGKFSSKDTPCVQVHHTGKSHWVTSFQHKKENAVYVLDSKSTEFKLTPSMEIQLSAIYGHGKRNLLVKLPDAQQQTNGYDCGVYAIANMMEYCDKGKFNTQRRTNFIENI